MGSGGVRVRLLVEWYNSTWTREDGEAKAAGARVQAQRLFPSAQLVDYVELNPPADEIEGLPLGSPPGPVHGLVTIGRTVMLTCPNCPTLMFKVDTLADANRCAAEHVCDPVEPDHGSPPVPPHKHVQLRSDAGLHDQDSLEERLRRAEHDNGLQIGKRFRQSHCWLCRQAAEEQEDVCRQRGHIFVEGKPYCTREPCQQRYPGKI